MPDDIDIPQNDTNGWLPQDGASDGPELKHYLAVIRRRIWVILTAFVIVATLGILAAFKATPVYEASARILIEKQSPRLMNFDDVLQLQGADNDYYLTQQELVTSRTVLEKALQQPGVRALLEGKGEGAGRRGVAALVAEVKRTVSAVLGVAPSAPPELWERLRQMVEVTQVRGTHLRRRWRTPSPMPSCSTTWSASWPTATRPSSSCRRRRPNRRRSSTRRRTPCKSSASGSKWSRST